MSGLAIAGQSGWTIRDEIERIEGKTGRRPVTLRVRRPAADVRAASAVALARGAEVVSTPGRPQDAPQIVEWDICGDCESPVVIEQSGEGHFQLAARVVGDAVWQPNRSLWVRVRCRKCAPCIRARRLRWERAGTMEWQRAESQGARTWFGTLTIRPEVRFRLLSRVRQRMAIEAPAGPMRGPGGLESLEPRHQFAELVREAQPLVTNFLKALRKGRKKAKIEAARFRYFLVSEPHQDWFPHFHLMMHEISPLLPLRKRAFELLWPHGFVKWRIATDTEAAKYCAKYLGKHSFARVRASIEYGGEFAEVLAQQEQLRF